MAIAELKIRFDAQPGLDELDALIATLEQVFADAPHLRLKVSDLLFTGSDHRFKPGLVDLVTTPAGGAFGPSIIQLHITDRFRKVVAAAVADELELLSID
ncbi:hypothetical protein [Pseudomonas asplenii]|uniref:hypothetical protein n=1 Tax=Pseudomonas asplenii TaxID=53407 RepID=UPI0006B6622F|nr:hypothetical protein [Pseudomonas fuscovaginae]